MSRCNEKILVIGYGSTLRGDDGVGRLVVELVAERSLPNVILISVTQLVPELAEQIAKAQAVIFVDACADGQAPSIEVREVNSMPIVPGASHIAAPSDLLALTSACYEREPRAWLVSVPSTAFGLTERISSVAQRQARVAARAVERLINNLNENEVVHA